MVKLTRKDVNGTLLSTTFFYWMSIYLVKWSSWEVLVRLANVLRPTCSCSLFMLCSLSCGTVDLLGGCNRFGATYFFIPQGRCDFHGVWKRKEFTGIHGQYDDPLCRMQSNAALVYVVRFTLRQFGECTEYAARVWKPLAPGRPDDWIVYGGAKCCQRYHTCPFNVRIYEMCISLHAPSRKRQMRARFTSHSEVWVHKSLHKCGSTSHWEVWVHMSLRSVGPQVTQKCGFTSHSEMWVHKSFRNVGPKVTQKCGSTSHSAWNSVTLLASELWWGF
jgi:hypothetical protein